jgi:hypothetical protein
MPRVNRWAAAFIDMATAAFMLWVISLQRGFWIKTCLVIVLLFLPAASASRN